MALPKLPLPEGIQSHYVAASDLIVHFLDAKPETGSNPPVVLLLHGFPELAFSWRSIMRPIADLGYRVIAPDLRGFGRTVLQSKPKGHVSDYAEPIDAFRMSNYVRDALALVFALGYQEIACVVGHDFGSAVAAFCALTRPDVFRAVVLMSAPFLGAPRLSSGGPVTDSLSEQEVEVAKIKPNIHESLDMLFANMKPPRMHYQHYFSSSQAAHDMDLPTAPELRAFMRRYFHIKSAEWGPASSPEVRPRPLKGWVADEVTRLPAYYLMPRGVTMPEAVASACEVHIGMGGERDVSSWMDEEELMVFVSEYGRTGFQSALNKYRCVTSDIDIPIGTAGTAKAHKDYLEDLSLFSHLKITIPSIFISGELDWGPYQSPGALERMKNELCTDMRDVVFIPNAGHWVQQEQPERVTIALGAFLTEISKVSES
ncbi:alpha/beta-hydrolase [Schizopora paradoxa]|uniref:Alpha/beta-hydrolase n=1 Tax=Schizopora paradoxa TaxID=27342 RepID=A0A0H2RXX6_9AGAM|nr:alpha/beta-hydrolase [Schizopora paradoxa]